MNYLYIIISVIVGMTIYNFIKEYIDINTEFKERDNEHKELLRWIKETEDNIKNGKDIEKNTSSLETLNKLLSDFYKKHSK